MTAVFGSGNYRYRVLEGLAKWPDEWQLGDVAAVAVDRNDRVYAFHRGDRRPKPDKTLTKLLHCLPSNAKG
jgi:hypothetical protein